MLNEPFITMQGNAVEDSPELRFTPTGKSVCSLTIACNPRRRNPSGEWESVDNATVYIRINCWGMLAECVAESVHRGMPLIVAGYYQQRKWETREGEKRTQNEILASTVGIALDNRIVRNVQKVTRDVARDSSQETPNDPEDTEQDDATQSSPDAASDAPKTAQKSSRK